MMTESARAALLNARSKAEAIGKPFSTTHVLLALFECESSIPEIVLRENGVSFERILEIATSEQPEEITTLYGEFIRIGLVLGHRYPGLEHLLLTICCKSNCNASRALMSVGIAPGFLVRSVLEILGMHHLPFVLNPNQSERLDG